MRINYEADPLKHYVRRHGWLTAARQQKQTIRRSKNIPLRYFTFCAAEAIDVFMLEREGILERSAETERLEGVYFCETEDESFGTIADLIGSPQQGFQGRFERIVLFEDDKETKGKTFTDEEFYSQEIRRKLRDKDAHYRLREAFPFDIINLDVCGVMFPPRKNIIAPLLESIIQILEWQTNSKFPNDRKCDQFTLFLTSHIDPDQTNQKAIQQLTNMVIENINISVDFQSAFVDQYGHDEVKKLVSENFAEFICLALPKFIIRQALFNYGWEVVPGSTYLFDRENKWNRNRPYQIMHTVSVYQRIPNFQEHLDVPNPSQYIQSVTQLVNDEIKWVDDIVENSDILQELQEDLRRIVELRDQRHNS